MSNQNVKEQRDSGIRRSLFISLVIIGMALSGAVTMMAQTETPTPEIDVLVNGYKVNGSAEFGWRWRSLDGNVNKYRSDLNYKKGFRSFDSNLLLQSREGKGRYFDSLLITNSGWGADPIGRTRVNVEKTGAYKFESNVRKVTYFNNLFNFANPVGFANSEHAADVRHTFGDFDITVFPQSERLRVSFGVSFNDITGNGGTTERFFSDEFAVLSKVSNNSMDYRIGAEGKLWGFDWGVTQGFRTFKDHSENFINGPNEGNTSNNQSRLDSFFRSYPTQTDASYTQLNLHRLIRDRFDFTGRLIYSTTKSDSSTLLLMTGRDNTNPVGNIVNFNRIDINAQAKRPQTRGDLGFTYAVTNKFRLSNTFTFDQFAVNGGERSVEVWRKLTGPELSKVTTITGYRRDAYRRFTNTFEGDYQFNKAWAFHLGYRYTNRRTSDTGFNTSCATTTTNTSCPPTPPTVTLIDESERNSTNAVIAGMRIKPVHNWVVFWDVEHGKADNVFTRLENYRYTNFRVRSRLAIDKFTLNLSAVSKDNENPSEPRASIILPPGLDFITVSKNRFYSGSLDWEPDSRFFLSTGYTFRHLTSHTPVALPFSVNNQSIYVFGLSEFFIRDHYVFFDITAKPMDRVSLYASYRLDVDKGQGDRVSSPINAANPNFVTSYPINFTTPEFRVAIRLNRNVDWNIGYQYYNYKDRQTPFENYKAHLPYTSLRIYFGGRAADR